VRAFFEYRRIIWKNVSDPCAWKKCRLLKSGAPIGYGKNISVKAEAEIIKDYSMDSLTPAVSGAGKQTFI